MSESSTVYKPIPPKFAGFVSAIAGRLNYRVGYFPTPLVWSEGDLLHVVVEVPENMAGQFFKRAGTEPHKSLKEIALQLLDRPNLFTEAGIIPEMAGEMSVILIPAQLSPAGLRLWIRELMRELAERRRFVRTQIDELPPYRYFDLEQGCFIDL